MSKIATPRRPDSLLPSERQQRILELIREGAAIRVSRLSELLGVSEMTIRRDLVLLEQRGVVERTHGGAIFRQERKIGKFKYQKSIQKNPEEKKRIARRAAALIEPNDTVYLGEGTTAPLVLRYADPAMVFSVFTNNLGAVSEVQDKAAELVLLGGTYNPASHALEGSITMDMIHQVYANKVFLGADGLSLSAGVTTPNLEIAVIERNMIRHTRGQVILMADHSKFGLVAEIVVSPVKRADVLITDREIPGEFQKDLESMGIRVLIA